jgi:hypothetical protein
LRQLRAIFPAGDHLDCAKWASDNAVFATDTLGLGKLDAVVGDIQRLGRAGGDARRVVAMVASGRSTGIPVEDNMDARNKRAALCRPGILMMRRDAGYFAGMTSNTVRNIGHNKSIHLLPFYSSGIVLGMDCNIRAIFGAQLM